MGSLMSFAMAAPTSSATLDIEHNPALLGDMEGNKRPRKAVLLALCGALCLAAVFVVASHRDSLQPPSQPSELVSDVKTRTSEPAVSKLDACWEDPSTGRYCCNGIQRNDVPSTPGNIMMCCGDQVISLNMQICCGGWPQNLQGVTGRTACCNRRAYNLDMSKCCN